MKRSALVLLLLVGLASQALAIPSLQVGAPAGAGDTGTYANYFATLVSPPEADTAVTRGGTIYAVGAYSVQPELLLGGQYNSTSKNWTDFTDKRGQTTYTFDSSFNQQRAVLMATVPDGTLGSGSLTVNGNAAFYSTAAYESGFFVPNPPANHAPIPDQDYLFFNIGDFAKSINVPNLPDETTGNQLGEIKTLPILVSGFDWIHFDVFAIMTDTKGQSTIVSTLEGNPGSHDLTWKKPGNGGGGQETPVPEPGTFVLLGSGLVALGLFGRRKLRK